MGSGLPLTKCNAGVTNNATPIASGVTGIAQVEQVRLKQVMTCSQQQTIDRCRTAGLLVLNAGAKCQHLLDRRSIDPLRLAALSAKGRLVLSRDRGANWTDAVSTAP